MPISDLITIAAHRIFLEERKESYKAESVERGKEALSLRQALAEKDAAAKIQQEREERLLGELSDMDDRLGECLDKQAKLKTWATVGRVGTITFSLAIVGIVAERVINSANP